MAGRPKQPINLIIAKGKKHLTKEEISQRQDSEVKVNYTDIKVPEYLSEKEKQEFCKIANILLDVGIMTELDEDCLAHYLIANSNYIQYTKKIRELNNKILNAKRTDIKRKTESEIDTYLIYQDRALKQCRACANDLGLSISSRCKLVMPPSKEQPKENKFAKFKVTGQ